MTPDSAVAPERLAALPRLPRDTGGPVFAEPWEAQAFALAVKLSVAPGRVRSARMICWRWVSPPSLGSMAP